MTKLPVVDFKTIEKLFNQLGFKVVRQRGSHVFFKHADGRTALIPNHGSKVLNRPLLREILNGAKISIDEYRKILDNL